MILSMTDAGPHPTDAAGPEDIVEGGEGHATTDPTCAIPSGKPTQEAEE